MSSRCADWAAKRPLLAERHPPLHFVSGGFRGDSAVRFSAAGAALPGFLIGGRESSADSNSALSRSVTNVFSDD